MPGRDIHGHRSPPLPEPPLFYFADKFPTLLRPPPWLLSILKPALKPVRKELEIYRGEGIWNIVLANIESAKQTRIVSHRFACTNASSLIFLFFSSPSLLWRKRERETRLEYTLCFPVWRSVFDQTRGEGTALSLVASVRYNPREGFSSKTTAGSGRFASKSDSTKSDFSKFRFSPPPRIARSHPSVFPLLLLPHRFPRKLRMKSGERIVSGSVFLLFFFFSPMHKTLSDYNEASYSEFFSGEERGGSEFDRSYRALLISILPFLYPI